MISVIAIRKKFRKKSCYLSQDSLDAASHGKRKNSFTPQINYDTNHVYLGLVPNQ